MGDAEGEKNDFDELDLPGDMPEEGGLADELAGLVDAEPAEEAAEVVAEVAEAEEEELAEGADEEEEAEEAEEEEAEGAEEEEKEKSKLPFFVEIAVVAVACIGIIAGTYFSVAATEGLFFWGVLCVYFLWLFFIAYVLWKTHKTCTPYRVMLALSLAAILTAVVCLIVELKTYNYDVGATEADQRARAVPALQLGPARTTAVDCPTFVQFNSMAAGLVVGRGSPRTT